MPRGQPAAGWHLGPAESRQADVCWQEIAGGVSAFSRSARQQAGAFCFRCGVQPPRRDRDPLAARAVVWWCYAGNRSGFCTRPPVQGLQLWQGRLGLLRPDHQTVFNKAVGEFGQRAGPGNLAEIRQRLLSGRLLRTDGA